MIKLLPSLRAILIGVAYFLCAAASVRFTRFDGGVAFIWVANALLIVELSLHRPKRWPATLLCSALASAAATIIFGLGVVAAPAVTLAVMLEAAAAAWLLRRWRGGRLDLGSMEGFVVFAAVAGLIAPLAGAIGGAAAIALATGSPFWNNALHWYVGHALGNILFAPILVLIMTGDLQREFGRLRKGRRVEALALSLTVIIVSAGVFAQEVFPVLFLPLLPMMLAAFRFGRIGSAVSIVLLALVGGALTLAGHGPVQMIQASVGMKVLFFQSFIVFTAFLTLPVAAVLQQSAGLFRALRESESRYRLLADRSSDVIVNLDRGGRIRYISPSVAELSGHDPALLIGTHASQLVLDEDREALADTQRRALADPGTTIILEYRGLTAAGATIWCETHTRGVTDEQDRVIGSVSQIRDITHHKRVAAALARAAQTDPLTGLPNRRAFDAVLDRRIDEVRNGQGTGCCAILDLDYFKQVNDRHGHEAGDRVLRRFADVATASLRDGDVIARLGGEEFGMLLWGADLGEALSVCERLRRDVEDLRIATDTGDTIGFTLSGGLVPITAGRTRHDLLRRADAALYRAKHAGRNRLVAAG
ncbi:diguanylate cyclase [Sphingomonas qilianensis]|uniref:diguanylate cyclase n=1 Tax=Sphingomonas qilianensis TaxID=1736690 RepID=A0ABU9XW89_9SPHN